MNDVALSKLCTWKDKDRAWLRAGLDGGVLSLPAMAARVGSISGPRAPEPAEMDRRLAAFGAWARP